MQHSIKAKDSKEKTVKPLRHENGNSGCIVVCGDSRQELKSHVGEVDLIVTSPPYADARRHHYDSIHPDKFAAWFLTFHQPFFDALKPNGSLVINIKDKVVEGTRHRYVWDTIKALCNLGWFAIDDYIWHKTNPMPGFWPNRLRDGWEYCFHLSKARKPYMNQDAVRQPVGEWVGARLAKPGQNDLTRHNSVNKSGFGRDLSRWVGKKTVLPTNIVSAALVGKSKGHPAVFPVELPLFFIKLLCPPDGLVVDPFGGSGTTAIAASQLNRRCVLIDNNPTYCEVAAARVRREAKGYPVELLGSTHRNGIRKAEPIPAQIEEQIRFFETPPASYKAKRKRAAS